MKKIESKKSNKLNIFFQTVFIGIITEQTTEGIILSAKNHEWMSVLVYLTVGTIAAITINSIWDWRKNTL